MINYRSLNQEVCINGENVFLSRSNSEGSDIFIVWIPAFAGMTVRGGRYRLKALLRESWQWELMARSATGPY